MAFFSRRTTGDKWRFIGASLLLIALAVSPAFAQGTQTEKDRFELAQRLFNDGLYANAAQEFKQFVINFPTSDRLPDATLRLGEAYAAAGQYGEAAAAFQQFIDRYPNLLEVAGAMRARADALNQLGEYIKAGEAYQAVHAAYPEAEYAMQDLLSAGLAYHKGRALSEAEAAFRLLIAQYAQSPLVPEAIYNLGRVLLDADRTEEALVQFRALVDFSGPTERKPDALLEMGKIALSRDDLSEARRVFADLQQRFPKTPSAENAYLVLAAHYAARGNWAEAEKTYQQAQTALPRNPRRQQAVLGRANALRKLGRSTDALDLYTQFLRVYPKSPFLAHARLGYGRAFADLKNHRNALEAFKRLQEEFPDADVSIEAYSDIGDIWRALGASQKALSAYQLYAARVQAPEAKASAQLQIARIYEDLSWFDLAEESHRSLIAQNIPQYAAEGQFGLARVFEHTGQMERALREYRNYLKDFADGPRAEAAETRIQLLREFPPADTSDAIWANLIAALPAVAGDAQSQFQIGVFLFKRHRYAEAIARFQAALKPETPADWTPEAQFYFAQSHLRCARKAALENDDNAAAEARQKGLAAFKALIETHPESDRADDAALFVIAVETESLTPDSTRANRQIEAYTQFLKTHPKSDRADDARLAIADAHLLAGNIAEALAHYRAVQSEDHRERATFGIGVCQARQGQYAQAEETLRTFLFDHPRSDLSASAQFELGRIFMAREFYGSAAEEFAELLTAPSSLKLERESRSLLAECYFKLEDYKRAIDIDVGLLRRGPTPQLLRRLAQAYFNDDQHDRAVATYAQFLRRFPTAPDADSIAFARAERLSYLGRTAEAIAAFGDFSTTYAQSPLRARADESVGDLLFASQRYAEAIEAYGRIPAARRTESAAGREVLCLYRLKRIKAADKAAGRFKKAHKTATGWLALFDVEKGKYQLAIKKPKKARGIFQNVIKKHADTEASAEASYYIIRAYFDEGPDKEGNNEPYIDALNAFVKDFPDSPHWAAANLELAEFWEANEEYGLSAKAYRNALDKGVEKSRKPDILYKISKNYSFLKSYDLAISFARQLVREFPQHKLALEARMDIGTLLQFKGDHQAAIQELLPLLKVVTREDDRANIRYTIAESYFLMGDYDNARREFLVLRYNTRGSPNWIASAQYKIAECYVAQGAIERAIAELEEIKIKFGATSTFGLQADKRIRELKNGGDDQSDQPGR